MHSPRLLLLLCSALLLSGCAGSSRVAPGILHHPYATSRDGGLRYRLPAGWFDVTADPQSAGHALLLIRNDYRATIVVDESRQEELGPPELNHLIASALGFDDRRGATSIDVDEDPLQPSRVEALCMIYGDPPYCPEPSEPE